MFTIPQIKEAHAKVASGAGFPAFIRELKTLGVIEYSTYISDNHTDYSGEDKYQVSSAPNPESLLIADTADSAQFQANLKTHQQGGTDYPTFRNDCAKSGVLKWIVNIPQLTCTYYDKAGNEMLQEAIPA